MSPTEEYRARLAARRAEFDRAQRLFTRIGNLRLAAGVLFVVAAWLVFGQGWISPWWIAPPVAIFAVLALLHEREVRRGASASRSVSFYESGLARIEDRWHGKGHGAAAMLDPAHLYAADLDLFGPGSLFELLNTTRTQIGERKLADWLLAPTSLDEARARQLAVDELRPALDLREQLALLGHDARAAMNPQALLPWAARPPIHFNPITRPLAFVLAAATLAALVAYFAGLTRLTPFLALLLIELTWLFFQWPKIRTVIEPVESPARDLALFGAVLHRIESAPFQSPWLVSLKTAIETGGVPASVRIARLSRLVQRLDWARNQLFAPIAILLLWQAHIAVAIEHWRAVNAAYIAQWLDAAGSFEALCALAAFAYEHPAYPFPELLDGPPLLDASQLAHPLLPASATPNDLRLDAALRLLIVSGSNMSGKSTLLRAAGVNAVLAWAGAPVRAARFRISPLQVGASIRIVDSLQDGRSRFFAEITRLRQLVDRAGQNPPLFFLIDEMLSGTNSHDRRIGAEAVLKTLVEQGALGMVTTHDLALAEIAQSFPALARNVHFEDELRDGTLHFDYRLRDGIVKRSNALDLMRGLGLSV